MERPRLDTVISTLLEENGNEKGEDCLFVYMERSFIHELVPFEFTEWKKGSYFLVNYRVKWVF